MNLNTYLLLFIMGALLWISFAVGMVQGTVETAIMEIKEAHSNGR